MKTQNTRFSKKPTVPLLAMLLTFLLCSGALAESGTIFPWRAYTLDVTLATCDEALVAVDDAPANGTLALVELTTLSQAIQADDIMDYFTEFALRDVDGDEYEPFLWRVPDFSLDAQGEIELSPQNTVELVYLMKGKDAAAFEGAKLLIDTENVGERIVVTLSKAPSERADTAETTSEAETDAQATSALEPSQEPAITTTLKTASETSPTVTPSASQSVEAMLDALLIERAEVAVKKPWVKAIYEAGAKSIAVIGDSVSFQLRSFHPNPKSIEEGETDVLKHLMTNVSAYDVEITLTLEAQAFTVRSIKAMDAAITKAANAAQKAYGDKRVKAALVAWLLPVPAEKVKLPADMLEITQPFTNWIKQNSDLLYRGSAREWAPFFYGQTKQTLNAKGGPHALVLNCVSLVPEDLLKNAARDALDTVARQPGKSRAKNEALEEVFLALLSTNAFAMRKKAAEKFSLTLDVDDIAKGVRGDDYKTYIERYDYAEALNDFKEQVASLPEIPALDYPKSGRLNGSTSGTKIIIKAPKDGQGRYIQLRNYYTGEFAVSGFIHPGKSCTVRVPQGDYYLLIAIGAIWYGEEDIFGENSVLSRTELFEVASSRYYHTVTLEPKSGGNLSAFGVSGDEFVQ